MVTKQSLGEVYPYILLYVCTYAFFKIKKSTFVILLVFLSNLTKLMLLCTFNVAGLKSNKNRFITIFCFRVALIWLDFPLNNCKKRWNKIIFFKKMEKAETGKHNFACGIGSLVWRCFHGMKTRSYHPFLLSQNGCWLEIVTREPKNIDQT